MFFGLGLHVLVALYFAIHVIRSGQPIYWLFILFSFPLLGSIVYLVVIYLPASRLERSAGKIVNAAVKALDPTRELREAKAAFDYTPTAQNQMRLAAALLEAGEAHEALGHYEACLQGPFAMDPAMRLGAARASFACERFGDAILQLQEIRRHDDHFQAEIVAVLLAQALSHAGRQDEAAAEFAHALQRFGNFEVRAEYALWAISVGDQASARRLYQELADHIKHWQQHTRAHNQPMLKRLNAAYAALDLRL